MFATLKRVTGCGELMQRISHCYRSFYCLCHFLSLPGFAASAMGCGSISVRVCVPPRSSQLHWWCLAKLFCFVAFATFLTKTYFVSCLRCIFRYQGSSVWAWLYLTLLTLAFCKSYPAVTRSPPALTHSELRIKPLCRLSVILILQPVFYVMV